MAGDVTDQDRLAMVRVAMSRIDRAELVTALAHTGALDAQVPKVIRNALNALRRHRNPAAVLLRPQYRVAVPALAALVSDECLTRTIEILGDHAEEPTREQLVDAVTQAAEEFPMATVAVMLASAADSDMPASDLCFDLLATDDQFGLVDWRAAAGEPSGSTPDPEPHRGAEGAAGMPGKAPPSGRRGSATPPADAAARKRDAELREARRRKKRRDADERRSKQEHATRASERVREAMKRDRAVAVPRTAPPQAEEKRTSSTAPRIRRRAALTPVQEEEFDRADPWAAAVVVTWVPFKTPDLEQPEVTGKARPCVVVAGSATHLLVRPGYSEGGARSRDWRSVPLQQWRKAGLDQPTWVEDGLVRVERPDDASPLGWLATEDWNALW